MKICTIAEVVTVVSESEVLVLFVTPDGECITRTHFGIV